MSVRLYDVFDFRVSRDFDFCRLFTHTYEAQLFRTMKEPESRDQQDIDTTGGRPFLKPFLLFPF